MIYVTHFEYLSRLNDNFQSLAQFYRTALHRIGLWSLVWVSTRRPRRRDEVELDIFFGFPLSFHRFELSVI